MSFLSLCYGQCGNQIGDVLYSTILEDIKNDNESVYFDKSMRKWFNIERNGNWEARCILIDTENKVIPTKKQKIYGFKNVVAGCYGSSENNWAYGYNCQSDLVIDSILNMVRRENEKRYITSFLNVLSLGGGTGSGVGSKVIQELKNEYPKKNILNAIILPYLNGDLNTQSYNTVLSLAKLHSVTDSSILFENDKLYYACSSKSQNNINFNDLNKVIAFQLASIFQPLTCENDSFSINQLTSHNLYKYLQLKSSFPSTEYHKFESSQTWRNKLYPLIKQYEEFKGFKDTQIKTKIMMSAVITRGKDKPEVKVLEWFQSARNFVNWIPKDYHYSHYHESRNFCGRDKTLTILSNDNNICNFFNSTIENAWKLFTRKAYLHHYEKHDVSIEEFRLSFQQMENILAVSWSVIDKRDLLLALETHGPNNLEEIHKYLPEKSIMEIRFTIEKYKKLGFSRAKAFDNSKLEESSLNQWIKLLKRLSVNTQGIDDLVPRILKYIAYFEEHTSGAGINLRECYLALSELCRGESIKILDPYTAHFLYGCLTQLAEGIRTQNNEAMINFVKNIEEFEEIHRSQLVKSYSKKKAGSFDVNPLNVPTELLKMKDEFSQQE